uniref:Protein kinase domain-containing protein n=1 Tax=viral metagenome TaxID=1070528 RepID=A0A6C0F0A6_9ZZZZ
MVKRKPSVGSDLRTNSIGMAVSKYDMASLRSASSTHWGIENIQPFFPPIEKLFKTELLENVRDYGIRFENGVSDIKTVDTIRTSDSEIISVHKKVTMLLSPYKWMQGDYGTLGLPTSEEVSNIITQKIQNPSNAAYVGSILSVALSQTGCHHFPKVFGVFSGVSKEHTIDISDDYGDLSERSWFSTNIGKTFEIKLSDGIQESPDFKHTRSARLSIQLGDDIQLDGIEELDAPVVPPTEAGEMNRVFREEVEVDDDDMSDSSSVSTSYIFGIKSCDCESDESDDEEDDEDEDVEPFAWASFKNVPVQVTVIEKCTGTLFDLVTQNPETEKHLAWISQVMFALAFAQRNISFTHNDLHSNNVMYVPITAEYLYYNCAGTLYRVPTYGYLIKIIDFERSIGMVKLNGMKEPKLFMSDHFSIDEEAGGQYNCEPWYVSKYPTIKPNPSFDLVRLATSLFWDLFPEGPDNLEYATNPLFKFFMKWLTLEDGKSIMFKDGEPKHDRYHGFHLYKAIVRFCKENAVPRKEIASLKTIYGVDSTPAGEPVLFID